MPTQSQSVSVNRATYTVKLTTLMAGILELNQILSLRNQLNMPFNTENSKDSDTLFTALQ